MSATQDMRQVDVVVLGATPGGIAAAVAAARQGCSVLLAEPARHVGGMTASGLGKSDIENRDMIGGLFQEFTRGVLQHYRETYGPDSPNLASCHDGYYAEPSVAEAVLEALLAAQPTVSLLKGWELADATVEGNRLVAVRLEMPGAGRVLSARARVFIDATYEGDLYARAGAEFRVGRESRADFDEAHAGVVYFDYERQTFLPGTTGEGDDRLPAYTYRLCLTTDPDNAAVLSSAPPDYDQRDYLGYFDDLAAGRMQGPRVFKPGRGYNPAHFGTMVRALSVTDLPGGKTDVNINPRPLGFPFPEENRGYIEGDPATRRRISGRIRNLTFGLLWFLQNDPEILPEQRALARQYHLPRDEFTDNAHFPFQLYVREARRLVGEYTLTEHDITNLHGDPGVTRHADTVAIGEFPIDSFPCRKRQPGDTIVLEGYLGMLDHITRPYEIPYRVMIPRRVDGLIVPVAASTTHVAFSSIRMEPTWMAMGQAAGTAAALAVASGQRPRNLSMPALREELLRQGQVLSHGQ